MKKSIFFSSVFFILVAFVSCSRQPLPRPSTITFWVDRDFGCGFTSVEINGQYVGDLTRWQGFRPNPCSANGNTLAVNTFQGPLSIRFTNNCASWTEQLNLVNDCFVYQVD